MEGPWEVKKAVIEGRHNPAVLKRTLVFTDTHRLIKGFGADLASLLLFLRFI